MAVGQPNIISYEDPKVRKRRLIQWAGVAVFLVLCAGAGVAWRWHQQQGLSNKQPIFAQEHLKQEVVQARDLQANGKSDQANSVIANALATSKNDSERYELYLQQGANYENQQKYPDALTSYKNALAVKQTFTVYYNLGRVSEALGDKQAAINYYRSAVPLIDTKLPSGSADKRDLETKNKEQGG
jgi:tetratricopeptide (TPR) repeat protein